MEMRMQGAALEPILQRISDFLDRQADLVDKVHADLVRGLKRWRTGRDGISAAQMIRSYLLSRIKNWDLRELRERIADGYSLRLFTHFFSGRVPNHRTLNRNFNRLRPETVRLLNEAVVDAIVEMRVGNVRKMREDTSVTVPSNCTSCSRHYWFGLAPPPSPVRRSSRDVIGVAKRADGRTVEGTPPRG
jgi:IS5 family transposase